MRTFLLFFATTMLPLGLWAQQSEPLELEPLIEEALRNNRDILAAQKRLEAARQRPSQESTRPDPMLSLGYTSNGSPRPFAGLGMEPTSNAGFMLSQEFLFPGKTKLRGEIAGKEADAEYQAYRSVQLSVVSRLKQAYHRLHHGYEALDILRRNQDLLQRFIRIAEARYAVGQAAQQDIFKAQTQLAILETRAVRMEQDIASAEAELISLLNRPPGSPLARPPTIEPGTLTVTLEELYASARRQAPLLRREQKMIERTQLAVNLARKEYYPDYTLSAGYFNMGRMPDMYQFRVDFKLPAYFWRKQRQAVSEQAALVEEARRNYEAANQSLNFRIKDDYLMAQASFRLMEMYRNTVVPQAALALESSIPGYETGAVDFLSLLTNFITMVEYELNYHEEMLNFHLAQTRLEEMTGLELRSDL
jgi:cobalt-zinc-cadmium efflux system outer membrane protein